MDIRIETLTGTVFELKVSPFEPIGAIKWKLQMVEEIPFQQQRLIWKEQCLEDDFCLYDYGIPDGATLKLVLAIRGGPINTRKSESPEGMDTEMKEMEEFLEMNQDEIMSTLGLKDNKRMKLLVFVEGDQLSFYRVQEEEPRHEKAKTRQEEATEKLERARENLNTKDKMKVLKAKLSKVKREKESTSNESDNYKIEETIESDKLDSINTDDKLLNRKWSKTKKSIEKLETKAPIFPSIYPYLVKNEQNSPDKASSQNYTSGEKYKEAGAGPSSGDGQAGYLSAKSSSNKYEGTSLLLPKIAAKKERKTTPQISQRTKLPQIHEQTNTHHFETVKSAPKQILSSAFQENRTIQDQDFLKQIGSEVVSNLKQHPNTRSMGKQINRLASNTTNSRPPSMRPETKSPPPAWQQCLLTPLRAPTKSPSIIIDDTLKSPLDCLTSCEPTPQPTLMKPTWNLSLMQGNNSSAISPHMAPTKSQEEEIEAILQEALEEGLFETVEQCQSYRRELVFQSQMIEASNEDLNKQQKEMRLESKSKRIPPKSGRKSSEKNKQKSNISLTATEDKFDQRKPSHNLLPQITRRDQSKAHLTSSKKKKKKCPVCHKKLKLAETYLCRCGYSFCSVHRYPESHPCSFDYKTEGRRMLEKNNPMVIAPKLPKI